MCRSLLVLIQPYPVYYYRKYNYLQLRYSVIYHGIFVFTVYTLDIR